jgi:sarcosine oxidase
LERASGSRLLHRTGGLMIGQPGSSVVEGAIRSATRHCLPFQVLSSVEIRTRFPALTPRVNEVAMYESIAGYLRPEAAIRAHLEFAEKHSADLHFNEAVSEWTAHSSGDGVTVKTAAGTYEAARLVMAPGAWAPDILSELQIPFDIRRHVMSWFQPLAHAGNFQADQFPIYIWDVDGHNVFYGFPATGSTADGVKVAIHSGGEPCTADSIDRQIRDPDVTEIRGHLQNFIPSLNGPLLRALTCMYTLTPDQHFVVGLHPRYPQVAIAAGFSGHGFKFSGVMGEILADLAIDGRTSQPIEFLSPNRFLI